MLVVLWVVSIATLLWVYDVRVCILVVAWVYFGSLVALMRWATVYYFVVGFLRGWVLFGLVHDLWILVVHCIATWVYMLFRY